MKNNGHKIFLQQFHHIVDIDQMLEMRDLIEAICQATGDSEKKVQMLVRMGFNPTAKEEESYDRLRELADQTHAWVVGDENSLYRIERRIFEAIALNAGWEMDNLVWVVEDGLRRSLRTTSHGSECEMTRQELMEKINETVSSLDELNHAKKMMGW
jgi:hypothetical protein